MLDAIACGATNVEWSSRIESSEISGKRECVSDRPHAQTKGKVCKNISDNAVFEDIAFALAAFDNGILRCKLLYPLL